ncbi:hypothetical protein DY252_14155 [Thalassospira indica]|uniref:Uncharacterized protein n=1 Tax=Thalassospira indica TaxID=1891279 RepID=A0ABN5NJ37_9PROT|nr:hypothetical protein DY252_14155 [Thalassospira indica]
MIGKLRVVIQRTYQRRGGSIFLNHRHFLQMIQLGSVRLLLMMKPDAKQLMQVARLHFDGQRDH